MEQHRKDIIALSSGVPASLMPLASNSDINPLESRIGMALPDSFKRYLAVLNGQNDAGREHPLIGHNTFLPVSRVTAVMDTMQLPFADEDRLEHISENKVQPVLWDAGWVPFSDFEANPRPTPKAGAQCGNLARWDLSGGP